MDRADRDRAVFLGLAALQDIVDQARRGPAPPSIHLRALLALLHLHSGGDRECFDRFWAYCRKPLDPTTYADPQHYERGTNAQVMWCGIVRALGFSPVSMEFNERIGRALKQARQEALGEPEGAPEGQNEKSRASQPRT